MFTVTANITIPAEHAPALRELLVTASNVYTKDKGTLAWLVHVSPQNPNEFIIVEIYENPAALETHTANPFYREFMNKAKDWAAKVDVRKWEPLAGGVELNGKL
ncbi:hypothetical protein HDU86_005927 [Geranomyces michiganensis]|nr:hypothetical protein HDU86_005927 [Geranomyces michiganensis]